MERQFQPPPPRAVERGRQILGTFNAPLEDVNLIDASLTPPLPRMARGFRLKEWQAVQLVNERWFAIVALFDAKVMALVQAKLFDRQTREVWKFERKVLPGAFENPRQVLDSTYAYRKPGCVVAFANRLKDGVIEVELEIPGDADRPPLVGRVVGRSTGTELHVGSFPFGRGRGAVSHKAMLSAEGQLTLGETPIVFDAASSALLLDHHKGYYPYVMEWDWVTAAGVVGGARVGLNLTRNASTDAARYNENCVWIDGAPLLLPAVTFTRVGGGTDEIWRAQDRAGRVDVRFHIEVDTRVDVNALIVRSKYRGPFGHVEGHVEPEGAERVTLDGMSAMAEEFYLRA